MGYLKKFKWYQDENEGWKQTIHLQANEIPKMNEILNSVIRDNELSPRERETGEGHFIVQLVNIHLEMQQLDSEIGRQQERLHRISTMDKTEVMDDIDAFCTQDILRDRIRNIEKSYLEMKCNFMSYLSTIL